MKHLLDTNACIHYLKNPDSNVRRRIENSLPGEIVVCSVVKAELLFGAQRSQSPQQTLKEQLYFLASFDSLPFDDAAARIYAEIRAYLQQQGTPIGPNDLLIASIALANNLTLVTHNTREFSRVPNLSLEDWE